MSNRYEVENSKEKYSSKFRFIKTCSMIATWIVFGMVCEVFGPATEYLKAYLQIDYNRLSFLTTLKQSSFLIVILLGGVLFDKFSFYADLIMCCASILLIVRMYHLFLIRIYSY
jgi:hypothetical protein